MHGLGILFFPRNGFFYGYFDKNKISGPGVLVENGFDIIAGFWSDGDTYGVSFSYKHSESKWIINEKSGDGDDIMKEIKDVENGYFLFFYGLFQIFLIIVIYFLF